MAAARYLAKTSEYVTQYAQYTADNLPDGAELSTYVDDVPCTLEALSSIAYDGRKVKIVAKLSDGKERTDLFLVKDRADGEASAIADLVRAYQEERKQTTQTVGDLFRIVDSAAKAMAKSTKTMSKMLRKTAKAHNRMAELEALAAERKTGADAAKEMLEAVSAAIGPEKTAELAERLYADFVGKSSGNGDASGKRKKPKKHKRANTRRGEAVSAEPCESGSDGANGGDVSPASEDAS